MLKPSEGKHIVYIRKFTSIKRGTLKFHVFVHLDQVWLNQATRPRLAAGKVCLTSESRVSKSSGAIERRIRTLGVVTIRANLSGNCLSWL